MRALWFGLGGAPIAWSINEVVNTALVSHNCYPGDSPLSAPLIGALSGVVAIVSLAAIIVGVLALITALRSWRVVRDGRSNDPGPSLAGPPPGGRSRFMARAGIAVSTVFLGGMVLQAIAIAMVHPCAGLAP
jgi:hypothetical protein